jgi:hypothetical protein
MGRLWCWVGKEDRSGLRSGDCGSGVGVALLTLSGTKVEPIPDNLSFKQLSMAFIETCLTNVWPLKIKFVIGPLFVIGASTLSP